MKQEKLLILVFSVITIGILSSCGVFAIDVSDCGTLNVVGGSYIQTIDITDNRLLPSDCIVINADNITFNGNGHKISKSSIQGCVDGKIIIINANNVSIINTNLSLSGGGTWGIHMTGNNSYISNNTITINTAGGCGSYVYVSGQQNTIQNNTLTELDTMFASSIYVSGQQNTIQNNNLTARGRKIYLVNSPFSVVQNNILNTLSINGTTKSDYNITASNNGYDNNYVYYNFSISDYEYNLSTSPNPLSVACHYCNKINITDLWNNKINAIGTSNLIVDNSTLSSVTIDQCNNVTFTDSLENTSYICGDFGISNTDNISAIGLTGFTIVLNNVTNSNFLNIEATADTFGCSYGIFIGQNSSNIQINNLTTSSITYGAYINTENNDPRVFIYNSSFSLSSAGIFIGNISNILLDGITTIASTYGVQLSSMTKNISILNSNLLNSTTLDFYMATPAQADYCIHNLTNVNTTGYVPLYYYTGPVSLSNSIIKQVILCNSSNSNLTSINISYNTGLNGVYSYFSNNLNLSSINFVNATNGVYALNSSNFTLSNNFINQTNISFYFIDSSNINIKSNNVGIGSINISSLGTGNILNVEHNTGIKIITSSLLNTTVNNNSITKGRGITITGSQIIVTNNTITGSQGYAMNISLNNGSCAIQNNNISNDNQGLYLNPSSGGFSSLSIKDNTLMNITREAIEVYNTGGVQIINNTLKAVCGDGDSASYSTNPCNVNRLNAVLLSGVNNSNITNNFMNNTLGYMLKLQNSNNNTFSGNRISYKLYGKSYPNDGLLNLYSSNSNIFSGGVVGESIKDSIQLNSSNNNIFRDFSINVSVYAHISLVNYSINNTFLNITMDELYIAPKESLSSNSNLFRKWYVYTQVNSSAHLGIPGVTVISYNRTGALIDNQTTDSTGLAISQLIEYYNNGGTKSYYSNYTINATKSGWGNSSISLNVTGNIGEARDFLSLCRIFQVPRWLVLFYQRHGITLPTSVCL